MWKDAWKDLIARYEGRLLAFAQSRLPNDSEEVVQDTFMGFDYSLPNYDDKRCLEAYLFAICRHKLTDRLRHKGRRPTVRLPGGSTSGRGNELSGGIPTPSYLVRSDERRDIEEKALSRAISEQVDYWQQRGDWTKLKCVELLFVRDWANNKVASDLGITEQQVANFKHDFREKVKSALKRPDVFPELYE